MICIDSDSPESRRILFIGTDNFRVGVESGNRMANLLHGHGRVVLITILAQLNVNERLRGVQETLKRYPEIEIAEVIDDKGNPGEAEAQVSALLKSEVLIPMKVVSDSDLIPVTRSDAMPVMIGAQRRW